MNAESELTSGVLAGIVIGAVSVGTIIFILKFIGG